MTFEEALFAYLAGDAGVAALLGTGGSPAGAKIYPSIAAQGALPPYAVYQIVGAEPTADLSGPSISHTRLQIDVYAKTFADVAAAAKAINDALDGQSPTVPGLGRMAFVRISRHDLDDAEGETRLRRRLQEYSVWHPE